MAEIALVHVTAPPVVGGVERVLGRQAVMLADDGHRVRVVAGRGEAPRPDITFQRVALADSVAPEIVAVRRALAAGDRPDDYAAVVARLGEQLGEALAGVDVVIVHNLASLDVNLALTEALHGIAVDGPARFVLWHHDLAWTRPADRARLHPGSPWSLLRSVWPGALQVAVSEARRRELAGLQGLDPATITVIPNGVDLPVPADVAVPQALVDVAMSTDPLLVLPARIAPRKNIELALRIVAAMRELGRPAGLVVTGPIDPHEGGGAGPPYLASLVELRASLGLEDAAWMAATAIDEPLSDAAVDAIYGMVDAMILPSRDEGFGLPVLEAALRRLPIVCSDLPVLRELAGEAGLYIDPEGDPSAAAKAILARLDGDPAAVLSGRVRRGWSWPAIHRRHLVPLIDRALGR
jgi:glycosyltransferase involved in cell wall biosynthesis